MLRELSGSQRLMPELQCTHDTTLPCMQSCCDCAAHPAPDAALGLGLDLLQDAVLLIPEPVVVRIDVLVHLVPRPPQLHPAPMLSALSPPWLLPQGSRVSSGGHFWLQETASFFTLPVQSKRPSMQKKEDWQQGSTPVAGHPFQIALSHQEAALQPQSTCKTGLFASRNSTC